MKVKFKSDNAILQRLKLNDNGEIQAFFTDTCIKHMDKYVPKDIGNLRDNISKEIDSVTYESVYARYQFEGQRQDGTRKISHWTTPRYWAILARKNEKC